MKVTSATTLISATPALPNVVSVVSLPSKGQAHLIVISVAVVCSIANCCTGSSIVPFASTVVSAPPTPVYVIFTGILFAFVIVNTIFASAATSPVFFNANFTEPSVPGATTFFPSFDFTVSPYDVWNKLNAIVFVSRSAPSNDHFATLAVSEPCTC